MVKTLQERRNIVISTKPPIRRHHFYLHEDPAIQHGLSKQVAICQGAQQASPQRVLIMTCQLSRAAWQGL